MDAITVTRKRKFSKRNRKTTPLTERFWRKVEKAPGDQCWEWRGARSGCGYGTIGDGRRESVKYLRAHRVSYEIAYGPIPDGLMVCHHCDNGFCVRPDHLFLGTAKDNSRDMLRKGRGSPPPRAGKGRPGNRGCRILNADLAKHIRASYAAGESAPKLAVRLGLGSTTIYRVLRDSRWD